MRVTRRALFFTAGFLALFGAAAGPSYAEILIHDYIIRVQPDYEKTAPTQFQGEYRSDLYPSRPAGVDREGVYFQNPYEDRSAVRVNPSTGRAAGSPFIVPVPFSKSYQSPKAFYDTIAPFRSVNSPNEKYFSSYKFQSVRIEMNSLPDFRQQASVCLPAQNLQLRDFSDAGGTPAASRYLLSNPSVNNFLVGSYGELGADENLKDAYVFYNVSRVQSFLNTTCKDGISSMVKVQTFVFPGWGLSNYNVYNYGSKSMNAVPEKERGISPVNGYVDLYQFLYMLHERYNLAAWNLTDAEKLVGPKESYGGLVISTNNINESIEFEFLNDISIANGQLQNANFQKVCVPGPAEVYKSGYYNILKLSRQLNAPVNYIDPLQDVVYLVKSGTGTYTLLYGIMPTLRFPRKFNNPGCAR